MGALDMWARIFITFNMTCSKVTFDGSVHGIFQICLNLPQYSLIKISVTRKLNLKLVLVLESGQCGLVS